VGLIGGAAGKGDWDWRHLTQLLEHRLVPREAASHIALDIWLSITGINIQDDIFSSTTATATSQEFWRLV
jgi:hypothetical protein